MKLSRLVFLTVVLSLLVAAAASAMPVQNVDPSMPGTGGSFSECTRVDGCYACDWRNRCTFIPYMSGGGCGCKDLPVVTSPGITTCQKYGRCTYVG